MDFCVAKEQQMPLCGLCGPHKSFRQRECPPILLDLIKSFQENMQDTTQVDGMISEPFPIVNCVKQGCVLAPILGYTSM